MNRDAETLRLLSIFHYVYAAITAMFSCLPLIYVFIGIAAIAGVLAKTADAPPAIVGGIFSIIGIIAFFLILGLAGLTAYAGKCLADRKHYTYCIVIAAINCLSFPFGTALGIFTIVLLQRAEVRNLFGLTSPET